ncbi:Protein of unknown function [Bacillus mycoides]|nr:Protein of unknown function [Bacillus mycoides]
MIRNVTMMQQLIAMSTLKKVFLPLY